MSTKRFPLFSTVVLYSVCHSQCPNDTLFVTCENDGWQDSSSCYSSTDKVIAYGWEPYWAYYEKAGGVDLSCENSVFGNPYGSGTKICCKLQYDLSGVSGLSPVVNTISCDETKHDYFKEGVSSTAHFWRFTLDEASLVTIENCNTIYDTKMYLRDFEGNRVSETIIGCDGDDCNCGWLLSEPNEKFIDVSLSAGVYYIEIIPYDSLSFAGTYYLSTECTAAPAPITSPTSSPSNPTIIPTKSPTDALSSSPTTPQPTGSPKTFCGKTSSWWCYDIDLYPSITTETNYTVFITNPQDEVATYFHIEATIHENHCVNPSILFSFEEIDFSNSYGNEYINLYDNDQSHLATCYGTQDEHCGHWIDCFGAPQPLGTNKINQDDTYSIYIEEKYGVDALCTQYHPYSMNAKLTIICSADSASPTVEPTVDPTLAPSTAPTSAPSNAPSSTPSPAPSAPPTPAPSGAPTLDPTNAPSTDPSNAPSANPTLIPTDVPSETPTKKSILAVHPSAPTSLPTSSPTHPEAEVRDTDGDGDDTDGDDEQSQQDAADKEDQKENTFVVMIVASVSLFAVCCVLIICVFYQYKKKQKLTNNALQQQKSIGSELHDNAAKQPGQRDSDQDVSGSNTEPLRITEEGLPDNAHRSNSFDAIFVKNEEESAESDPNFHGPLHIITTKDAPVNNEDSVKQKESQ